LRQGWFLVMMGYKNVKFLDGGVENWKKAGYEIVKKP
jgi:3-mercaptopyruvate sulfurtransferase SseA